MKVSRPTGVYTPRCVGQRACPTGHSARDTVGQRDGTQPRGQTLALFEGRLLARARVFSPTSHFSGVRARYRSK